jgi:hypothetical protein
MLFTNIIGAFYCISLSFHDADGFELAHPLIKKANSAIIKFFFIYNKLTKDEVPAQKGGCNCTMQKVLLPLAGPRHLHF